MVKEHFSTLRKLLMGVDLLIVVGCFFLGWHIANAIDDVGSLHIYIGQLPLLVLIWAVTLKFVDVYESFRVKDIFDVLLSILEAAFFCIAFFGSYLYLFKIQEVNPAFMLFILVFTSAALILEKSGMILFFRYVRTKGYNYRVLLVVGTGKRARQFVHLVTRHKEWGFKIAGLIDKDKKKVGEEIEGYKVIGTLSDVSDLIHNNVIDQVIFVVPRTWLGDIEEVMKECELEGIKISVAVNYFALKLAKAKQTDFQEFPLLTFESTPDKDLQLLIKNIFDTVFSFIALILLLPVFILISLTIKLTSPGPVLFKQERCGVNGRRFMLKKFRTMVADAEAQLESLRAHNEMGGPAFKMKNDPRITKIGKFLRKFSLDEFPQLWNVFRGDMSIVGPRPPLPREVEKYDNWQRRRLSMKPGLTCLWQVSGRNRIEDFDQWMNLDLEYIDNWSLFWDAKIFLKTIPAVLWGVGAK